MRIDKLTVDSVHPGSINGDQSSQPAHEAILEARHLSKRFSAVVANDQVSLTLRSHEIHGLLGPNGCGKSTLIGMLSGTIQPTEGSIFHRGNAVEFSSALEARHAGIATVFQEFSLVPHLTVAENIFLGQKQPKTGLGLVDFSELRIRAQRVLRRLQIDDQFSVDDTIAQLSVAHQQLVEIAKAVSLGGQSLILDEPTAALSHSEVDNLHRLLRRLRADGASILYVSHRLEEVIDIVDCATVLRDGRVVSRADETPLTVDDIVATMIGGPVAGIRSHETSATPDIALSVRNFETMGGVLADFDVYRGEVFGIAGAMGSGRSELLRVLFGEGRKLRGTIMLDGQVFEPESPGYCVRCGVAYVPENRKTDSLFFNFDSVRNATIASLQRVSRMSWISRSRERASFSEYQQAMAMPSSALTVGPGQLSGGNQQKLVLARWLLAGSKLFLLDEPTNGVDVGAKRSILDLIATIVDEGRSVILVSSELKELLEWSDRIAVMHSGVMSEAIPANTLNEESLTAAITGN